jgi:predicted TPR repeat methyltransferase
MLLPPTARYEAALRDADQCIALAPEWHKGHARRAGTCVQLGRDEDAFHAYERAVALAGGTAEATDYEAKLAQLSTALAKQHAAHQQRGRANAAASPFGHVEARVLAPGGEVIFARLRIFS